MLIPLVPSADWHHVPFSNRPANTIQFVDEGIQIKVDSSSSPLFYKLPTPVTTTGLKLRAKISGLPDLHGQAEGSPEGDDSALRIGLVEANEDPPGALSKLFLPKWIRQILDLLPDQGVERVSLFSISQQHPPGTNLPRPGMKLLREEIMLTQSKPGKIDVRYETGKSVPTSALWIQADGDDTKSSFEIKIEALALETTGP